MIKACCLFSLATAYSAFAGHAPTLEGTWRLDVNSSQLHRPLQDQTLLFEKSGTRLRLTMDSVEPNRTAKLILPCDGKEHRENGANGEVCQIKHSGTELHIRGGDEVRQHGTLSTDGNTLTVTRHHGSNTETLVYLRTRN